MSTKEILESIDSYLSNGGFFNPEMMDHKKVSELLLACRENVAATQNLFSEVERQIKAHGGSLSVSFDKSGGGLGLYWSSNLPHHRKGIVNLLGWPYCHGCTLEQSFTVLVTEFQRFERESQEKEARKNVVTDTDNLWKVRAEIAEAKLKELEKVLVK